MEVIKAVGDILVVKISLEERDILVNCLGYLCHAHRPGTIHTLTGATFTGVVEFIHTLNSLTGSNPPKRDEDGDQNIIVEIQLTQRHLISNCLGYLCHARVPENFSNLTGASINDVTALLQEFQGTYKK